MVTSSLGDPYFFFFQLWKESPVSVVCRAVTDIPEFIVLIGVGGCYSDLLQGIMLNYETPKTYPLNKLRVQVWSVIKFTLKYHGFT